MKKVKVFIEKSQYGYSAYMDDTSLDYSCLGEGKTVEETINDFNKAYNEMREHYAKEGKHFEEIIYEYEVFDKAKPKQSDIMEERDRARSHSNRQQCTARTENVKGTPEGMPYFS